MPTLLETIAHLNLPKVTGFQVPPVALKQAQDSGLSINLTCPGAPDQYELFKGNDAAGYLRVRWGQLLVSYPDVDGEMLYQESVDGFAVFSDESREAGLLFALDLIISRMDRA